MNKNEIFDLRVKTETHSTFLRAKILSPWFFIWLLVLSLNVTILVIMAIFRSVGFYPDPTIQIIAVGLVLFSGPMIVVYLIKFTKIVKKEKQALRKLFDTSLTYEDFLKEAIFYEN